MTWWKIWGREGVETPDFYEEGVSLAQQELYHDALTSFRLALKHNPDDPATLEQMAVAYTHIGQHTEAVRSYSRALDIRPKSPSAHYGLAFLLLRRGAEIEATRHLEAFLTHARSDREEGRQVVHAQRTLERLGTPAGEPVTQ